MNNGEKGAFACETNAKWNLGLTKREYFAGLAMQGMLAGGNYSETETAYCAVKLADELLKQLEL